jgi:predicted transcriptional regulator with HTH domain
MVPKYYVVLFKNKTRKKIIKKFSNFKNAEKFYTELTKKSSEVIFSKKIENGFECDYELGLLQNKSNDIFDVYKNDELGRNIQVVLEDPNYDLLKIADYRVEEQIYDIQKSKKILTEIFIKNYLKGDGLKMISTLNNKIIVQFDEKCNLFSVKSSEEARRYIDSLSQHFYNINRKDCMFVKDESTAQKKYLFELLFNLGVDKKILYRQYTTHPRG